VSDWTLREDGCFETGYVNTVQQHFSLIVLSSSSALSSLCFCTERP
jgi:hypothetical protein